MGGRTLAALGTVVLSVIGVAAVVAFFVSRDDATVPRAADDAPGTARRAGAEPRVMPGNVVLLYSDERLTSDLRRLAERIAGEPDPALAAAGQAVLVRRRPDGGAPVTALTATRMLAASSPDDPALTSFIEYWLGRRS